jgi:uncharacterized protein (DUF1499 family)
MKLFHPLILLSLTLLFVLPIVGAENLLAFKSCSSNTVLTGDAAYQPGNIVNPSNWIAENYLWHSGVVPAEKAWVICDLNASYTFNRMELYNRLDPYASEDFWVGYSDTNGSFTKWFNVTNQGSGTANNGTSVTFFREYSIEDGNISSDAAGRYVILNVTKSATGGDQKVRLFGWAIYFEEQPKEYPVIAAVNCTSCNIPLGDSSEPYTTSDTTPTFTFNTSVYANCRIAHSNMNYSDMGAARDCSSGQGTLQHTCTLGVSDGLSSSVDYVYLGCENFLNNNQTWNATAVLLMDITDLEVNASKSIEQGIEMSSIWPGATIYSNQQVYLRNKNNDQVLGTVDKVAVYGNQRWLFNYIADNESTIGLFNITPAVYVFEFANISLYEIKTQVSSLINSTKT